MVGVKVVTREPDVEAEMKRGNMREKWGLNLLYKINEGRLELCVKKGDILERSHNVWLSFWHHGAYNPLSCLFED